MTGGGWLRNIALILVCAALIVPLTLVDVPPLLDYPNHLARLVVLAANGADPIYARFYAPHWAITPNLALDLTVPPLLRIAPVHDVGRIVTGVILLLPLLGALAWHRALSGRPSLVPLTAALILYNGTSLRGFLNFIAAEGLALLIAAGWVVWRDRRPRLAIAFAAAGAVILFFCHLTGVLFLAVLLGAHEISPPWGVRILARRLAIFVAIFAGPLILYGMSALGHTGGETIFRSVSSKGQAALMPVINYIWLFDLATALLAVSAAALCVWRRWCVIPIPAAIALAVLVLLFLVSPTAFKGTFDLDTRFIIMASVLLPASMVPAAIPLWAVRWFAIGFVVLFTARMTVVATAWSDWRTDLADFRLAIAEVPLGAVVLTIDGPCGTNSGRLSDGTRISTHLPALLLIEHHAWWPFLFDNPSQQPIETREPYRTLAAHIESIPDRLAWLARGGPETRLITHVVVLGATHKTPAGLMLKQNHMAALFRLDPSQGPESPLP